MFPRDELVEYALYMLEDLKVGKVPFASSLFAYRADATFYCGPSILAPIA